MKNVLRNHAENDRRNSGAYRVSRTAAADGRGRIQREKSIMRARRIQGTSSSAASARQVPPRNSRSTEQTAVVSPVNRIADMVSPDMIFS